MKNKIINKIKNVDFYNIILFFYSICTLAFGYFTLFYTANGFAGIGIICLIITCTLFINAHSVIIMRNNKHNFNFLLKKLDERGVKHGKK